MHSSFARSLSGFVLALGICGLALVDPARAQAPLGRVQGLILDSSGTGLEKVEIALTSEKQRSRILKGKSKKEGKFVFPFVETGPYTVQVNLPGYKVLKVSFDSRDESGEDEFKKDYVLSPKDAIPTLDVPYTGNFGHCKVELTVVKEEEFVDAYRALMKPAGEAEKQAEAAAPAAPAAPDAPSAATRDPYDAGRQLAEAGKHAEAVPLFQQALAETPDDPNLLYALGRSHLEAGNAGEAEATLQKLVSLNPAYASAYFYLGQAQAAGFKNAAAIESYRKEIELSPDKQVSLLQHIALVQLVMAKMQPAMLEQARATLEEILTLEPNNTSALSQLADLYRQKGDRVRQEETYRRLVEADPANADITFFNLGAIAYNANRREEAAANFQKAIEINPKHAEAHLQLGYCLVGMGKIPEAVAHFEHYLALEPTGKRAGEVKKMVSQLKK